MECTFFPTLQLSTMKLVPQVAMSELRLIRTIERIDLLKNDGRWSFRQPKKQRGIGGLVKSHWDHLMDEMVGHSSCVFPRQC